ncbi:MAG TPA: aromatic amino acid transport family protein [Victivallales bacterium]|nr:aromatic amino acid transport family protein [Victivallales bacterium]
MLKFIGGILIVIGTCIGAGLLALPVSTSTTGFLYSIIVLIGSWIVMSFGAFFILEVTQWLPPGANLISIAKSTLGKKGEIAAWFLYLLLCYSLLCAYIAGGSDIFHSFSAKLDTPAGQSVTAVLFVLVLGFVVYKGIRDLDIVNRFLMIIKFTAFFVLIFLIFPHIKIPNLLSGNFRYILSAVTVAVTSFGFAIVIPSLLDYFNGNVKVVRRIIFCGTLIPLICYILWNFVIMGALPRTGNNGLIHILQTGNAGSGLVASLKDTLYLNSITDVGNVFAAVCMLTSFLGVSLALSDFIADGFQIKKNRKGKIKICALTFIPPLAIVIFYPQIFIVALSYAGIVVIMLLVLLPVIMVWSGRYKRKISDGYKVFGGKYSLVVVACIAVIILIIGILENLKIIP